MSYRLSENVYWIFWAQISRPKKIVFILCLFPTNLSSVLLETLFLQLYKFKIIEFGGKQTNHKKTKINEFFEPNKYIFIPQACLYLSRSYTYVHLKTYQKLVKFNIFLIFFCKNYFQACNFFNIYFLFYHNFFYFLFYIEITDIFLKYSWYLRKQKKTFWSLSISQ